MKGLKLRLKQKENNLERNNLLFINLVWVLSLVDMGEYSKLSLLRHFDLSVHLVNFL